MKALTGAQMRVLDRRTVEECGISGSQLMENAGTLAGDGIMEWLKTMGADRRTLRILVLAGPGNNGGDAFIAARRLALAGFTVNLHCIVPESELSGDALAAFRQLPAELRKNLACSLTERDFAFPRLLVVDGLLGTGFHGELREPYRTWCALVNRAGHPVAALDVPSGLDADCGEAAPDAVAADITFTMAAPKIGMFSPAGIRLSGRIQALDIGIPEKLIAEPPGSLECTDALTVKKFLHREDFDIHKYRRGHLCIAGGCRLYSGASLLAAEAAMRSGAGLVTCCLPAHTEISASAPKALIIRKLGSKDGFFNGEAAIELLEYAIRADAIAAGPGMGTAESCVEFINIILSTELPLVLDADALNLLAANPKLLEKLQKRPAVTVLTPHPGEMKRLTTALKISPESRTREQLTLEVASCLNAIVVSKGARSLVAAPDGKLTVNLSGCPALATAGSGDMLAGMTGAFLLNKQLSAFDAVRTAVFLHGYAAELAAPIGSRGWIADDFLTWIAPAMRRIRANL